MNALRNAKSYSPLISDSCLVLQLFPHRPRDQSGYIGRMHVFLARSCRSVRAGIYHIDATCQSLAIESRISRFCNYFCCAVVHVSATAIKYFWHEQVASIDPSQNVVGELLALRPLPAPNFRFLRFSPNFSEVCPEYSPALPGDN